MRVSGFTIIRDGVRLGYPFVESIQSILPLVDEFIINIGDCSDNTLDVINSLNSSKIEILENPWDPAMRKAGQVMAYQTNLALEKCTGDWCFYLQADEVVHEKDHALIQSAMLKNLNRKQVDGIRFKYLHFRGDYSIRDTLGYRSQVRIIRNNCGIQSVGDACGFGKSSGKLKSVSSRARVFHYGYVRPPKVMQAKDLQFQQFYIEDRDGNQINQVQDVLNQEYDNYVYEMRACVPYSGTHPHVMQERIANKDWESPACDLTPLWRNPRWWQGRLRKAFPFLKIKMPT